MKISQIISDLKYKKVNILDSGIFLHGLICNLSKKITHINVHIIKYKSVKDCFIIVRILSIITFTHALVCMCNLS